MRIKTLADVKRLPIGTRLRLVECLMGPVEEAKQGRTVIRHTSNALVVEADYKPGESWCYWPKAREFRADSNGFTVFEGEEIAARYEFIEEVDA